jgi:hypothetical protein
MSSMAEDRVLLVVEEVDSEAGVAVMNRRRFEDDEQAPLLNGSEHRSSFDTDNVPKSPRLEELKWYQRPSVRLGIHF